MNVRQHAANLFEPSMGARTQRLGRAIAGERRRLEKLTQTAG